MGPLAPHSKEVLVCDSKSLVPVQQPARSYSLSTKPSSARLDPDFVTGFTDGEAFFSIGLTKRSNGWVPSAMFGIHLHTKDLPLLYKIQSFFGGIGYISTGSRSQSVTFYVGNLNDIVNVIIPHFQKYLLRSAKGIDFRLWAECVKLMAAKKHLTEDGLNRILSLKSALNLGLSEQVKMQFSNVVPTIRPTYSVSVVPLNPNWISGFSDGESCFYVSITKSHQVLAFFQIELHTRETTLIYKIQEFFGGIGRINIPSKRDLSRFTVTKQQDLLKVIIPHFDAYALEGNKNKNYLIWREILMLVESKAHLTPEGLIQIKELKKELNK